MALALPIISATETNTLSCDKIPEKPLAKQNIQQVISTSCIPKADHYKSTTMGNSIM
jgi:hypothetical protein